MSILSLIAGRITYRVMTRRSTNNVLGTTDHLEFFLGTLFLIGILWPIFLVYIGLMKSQVAASFGSLALLAGFPIVFGAVARSESSTASLGLITLPYLIILPMLLIFLAIETAIRRTKS